MPENQPFERDRELIHRFNSASVPELVELLKRPAPQDERILRAHLGDERFERMHALALRRSTKRSAKLANVVVIHGIMGGELTATPPDDKASKVWLNYLQLVRGRFMWFELQPDGIHEVEGKPVLRATGMIQKYYGELTLRLSEHWNAVPFWFDWRKDIYRAAIELQERAAEAFGRRAPFHIVAHSMGGLVARTFIRQNKEAWKEMQKNGARLGGRLIMLGTPNYGSFAVPQIITGLEGILRKLDVADFGNSLSRYIQVANTFPGSYQMMPSVTAMPDMARLYEARTWQPVEVPQTMLDSGAAFHRDVDPVKDDWMVYIAGYGQDTISGVRDWERLDQQEGYATEEWEGDGRVPHKLGLLGAGRVFYVKEGHADLPMNEAVQEAADSLLLLDRNANLSIDRISATLPARKRAAAGDAVKAVQREARLQAELIELEAVSVRARGTRAMPESSEVRTEESRRAEELLVSGWLGSGPTDRGAADHGPVERELAVAEAALAAESGAAEHPDDRGAVIEIAIHRGNITTAHTLVKPAPDAVSVGLYVGVRPDGAARALDRSLSAAMGGGEDDLFLTQMLERGAIQANLGQPFILPDPRKGGAAGRVIALAGMGIPGRFGAPETTVATRELCWTLGRIGRRHLATVLIGSGVGNMSIESALEAWLRGIARAQGGMPADARLRRITFIELDPARARELEEMLGDLMGRLSSLLTVKYDGLSDSKEPVRRRTRRTETQEIRKSRPG